MWQKFLSYIFFWRKGQNKTDNFYLKMMHGINRISIWMFIIAMVILAVKLLRGL